MFKEMLWKLWITRSLFGMQTYSLGQESWVRPIGIGEIIRRILGRAVMRTFQKESAGDLQLCAGQRAGCEAAVHALSSMFSEDNSDAILLVDADNNAFNQTNRNVMLHKIPIICPIIATYVINSYSREARFFISGGEEITSAEGTTQGDPLCSWISSTIKYNNNR